MGSRESMVGRMGAMLSGNTVEESVGFVFLKDCF